MTPGAVDDAGAVDLITGNSPEALITLRSLSPVVGKFIRKPLRICNGANFGTGYYLGSVLCNTTDDCELPENTHNEIVDLAVLLATTTVNYLDEHDLLRNCFLVKDIEQIIDYS